MQPGYIAVLCVCKAGSEMCHLCDVAMSVDGAHLQISKLQAEIDNESENRAELARRTQAATNKKMKSSLETKMEKSDEKLDSMTVLMLHYCAGLQHCLDQEEVERVKQLEEEKRSGKDQDGAEDGVLESVITEQRDDVHVASVEDAASQNDDLNTVTMLADRTGEMEIDEELLMMNLMETEAGSDVEELTAQDVMLESTDEVVRSVSQTTVPHKTGDDLRTDACGETEIETTADTELTPATEPNVDREKARELSVSATLSVDTCHSETANCDSSVTCMGDDATQSVEDYGCMESPAVIQAWFLPLGGTMD